MIWFSVWYDPSGMILAPNENSDIMGDYVAAITPRVMVVTGNQIFGGWGW